MKSVTRSLICIVAVCIASGSSVTFGQFKFGKSGKGGSSRSNFSFRNNGSSGQSGRSQNSNSGSSSNFMNRFRQSQSSDRKTFGQSNVQNDVKNKGFSSLLKNRNLSGRNASNDKGKTASIIGNALSGNSTKRKFSTDTVRKTLPFFQSGQTNGKGDKHWTSYVNTIIKSNRQHWCHTRPAKCQWWVKYCAPIAHCHHNQVVVCNWNRVHCSAVIYAGRPAQNVQWYLGLKGIVLPGKGLGIDAVEAGSPAEAVGLRPGMVMTVCNGIELVDEASMQEAIRISGGVLNMTLLSEDGTQVLQGTVQMTRVSAVTF